MKKIFCLIIAFGIFVTSGIFATTARAEEIYADDSEFSCEPSITIDPETGNLGVDIYVFHENKLGFTNFEARIPFKGDMGNVTEVTLCKDVAGNADANIVKGTDGINYLNVIFSASKPVVSGEAKYKYNGASDDEKYSYIYIPKIMSIKTDKKAETEIADGIFSVKNLQFMSSQDTEDFIIEAGYKDNNGAIKAFPVKGICGFLALIPGDFDFDGDITIKDVIAAQYYYVNGVEAMSFGNIKVSKDFLGKDLGTTEVKKFLIPINSYITQFITSNVAGITDYGYVAALTLTFSQLATIKGSVSDLTDFL